MVYTILFLPSREGKFWGLYQHVKERLFFVSDAKIMPLFYIRTIGWRGKFPNRNERNEKVIFTGTNGIISSAIPSPVR